MGEHQFCFLYSHHKVLRRGVKKPLVSKIPNILPVIMTILGYLGVLLFLFLQLL
jgi:hypothetical protein